jgi:chromosome segregation ATPase
MDDNQQIVPLKRLIEFLKVENDQIGDYLKSTQLRLQEKEKLIEENNEKINNFNKIIEENQIVIKNLEAENEKHVKEKHIICQQNISDLIANCNKYKERIETLENENSKQTEKLTNLNQQIERYKQEQQNFNFKEFVNLKREVNLLKQERERKFADQVIQPNSISSAVVLAQQPLPPIKENKKNLFKFFN